MLSVIPLSCECGAVTGRITAADHIHRNICHCKGCQAYSRWLRRPELLDDAGGTDLLQITPSQLQIDQGEDQLRAVRQTPKGAVRWYTDCCRTPVANSLDAAWVPWLALSHGFVDSVQVGDTRAPELAPTRWIIHTRAALRPVEGGHPTGPASLVFSTLASTLVDTIKGRATPHPFFDGKQLRREPQLLGPGEREAIGLGDAPAPPVVRRKPAFGCG
ncbi:MAG: hypothetical protein KDA24_13820 [Deltaproteobacteria bacterium]|nr:hypothetical protein [Deltaproteobacteria bacterium]